MRWAYLVAMCAVSCAFAQEAVEGVPAEEAWRDTGKTETVCGQVVDSSYATSVATPSTYLYLEHPRPEQVFTVVIPFAKRDLFGDSPEKAFRGKRICVSGKIERDHLDGAVEPKHRATLVVDDEEQLTVR
jgi:hypothetical protein